MLHLFELHIVFSFFFLNYVKLDLIVRKKYFNFKVGGLILNRDTLGEDLPLSFPTLKVSAHKPRPRPDQPARGYDLIGLFILP